MTIKDHWQQLTLTETKELKEASRRLHYAAQYVAAFSHNLLPESSDDSQSSMHWSSSLKALVSQEVNLKRRVRMALGYTAFKLMLIDENEKVHGVFNINGQTRTTAMSFVRTQIRVLGVKGQEIDPIDHYELPDHPIKEGGPFMMTSPNEHQELARYRHNATHLLEQVVKDYEYATPVATWPHHFDTASVINLKFDDQSNPMKTVGVGLAPPNGLCEEYYFYISHWAKDGNIKYDTLPSLPGNAQWKTEDWKGAILPVSELVKLDSAEKQCELAEDFFKQGLKASFELLEEEAVKA